MSQYCCRIDETTLLPMNDLGAGVYQCPKCTSLRMFRDGFARRIGHDEAAQIMKAEQSGGLGVVLGGLALLAILGAATS